MLEKLGNTLTQHWRIAAGVVAGLALAAVLANVFLSFQASAVARRVVGVLAETARIEFEDPRASWNGDIAVRSLRITPLGRSRTATITADRATLHTPGVAWLTRTGLGRSGSPLPPASTLGLTLEGLGISGGNSWMPSADWLGIGSAAPFEALGCTDSRRFDTAELSAMGLSVGQGTLDARYTASSAGTGRLVVTINVPGSSHAEHTRDLRLPDAQRPLSASPGEVEVLEQSWAVRDDGFVQARNRRCAQRARLTRGQFVERHIRLLDRWLATRGLVADRELMAEYGHYAAQGGIMKWRSKPAEGTTLAKLDELEPAARMAALNAAFIANGRRAVAFRFTEFTKATATETGAAAAGAADPATGAALAAAPTADGTAAPAPADAVAASDTAPSDSTPAPVAATPVDPEPPAVAPATAPSPPPAASEPAAQPQAEVATPAAEPAAEVAATAAPAATPEAPAATPPAKPARPVVLQPGRVQYEQLENAVGREVSVRTIYGSRRVGTLMKFNRQALTLRLPMREGGLPLTMPRETIDTVDLLER